MTRDKNKKNIIFFIRLEFITSSMVVPKGWMSARAHFFDDRDKYNITYYINGMVRYYI